MSAESDRASALAASVWFEKMKYEQAEIKSQEILAQKHLGLKIEGQPIAAKKSEILTFLSEAKSKIEETLRSTSSTTIGSSKSSLTSLEQRVAKLEQQNEALTKRVDELEKLLKIQPSPPTMQATKPAASTEEKKDDDDFDLFGSDDEEDNEENERIKQERIEAYNKKKAGKKQIIAKSSIILDIKPWDDETDLKEMERLVRAIEVDGLLWKASKFLPVAYGIQKLQINCVVEDDKVGTDLLEEEILGLEDYVQSIDVVAFNKL